MCNNLMRARLLMKRGSGLPTIPSSPDHNDGSWLSTDIYVGEQYMDVDTGVIYTRTNNNDIVQISSQLVGVYKANISQSGTSAPIENAVFENTIGISSYSYSNVGGYRLTFATSLDVSNSIILFNGGFSFNPSIYQLQPFGTDSVDILSRDSTTGTATNSRIQNASISIEIYAPEIAS